MITVLRSIVMLMLLLSFFYVTAAPEEQSQRTARFTCPAPEGQFAHAHCARWYKCGAGVAREMSCPEDWLYDPEVGWCNWPHLVDCGNRLR
ncbi:hypothetical protein B566_EDAN004805 [Ephemera danica]|nr:hypothetical protein B566_EDAN004805 [Ephemera danica]